MPLLPPFSLLCLTNWPGGCTAHTGPHQEAWRTSWLALITPQTPTAPSPHSYQSKVKYWAPTEHSLYFYLQNMLIKAPLVWILCNVIVRAELEYEVSTVICGDINNDRYPGPGLIVPHNCSRSKFSLKIYEWERLWTRGKSEGVWFMFYQEVLRVLLESHPKDLHRFHSVHYFHSTERPNLYNDKTLI